jgi:hypothetical protein
MVCYMDSFPRKRRTEIEDVEESNKNLGKQADWEPA